jgi:putative ABC transport system permease protein
MSIIKLILKNSLRHPLRSILTIAGISIAVMAFGLIRTIVTAWSYGVEASAANRMITRHAVSFIFPLPLSYRDKISRVPGVSDVSYANWFGGVYKDASDWKNFFPRFAVDADTYFELYSEFIVPPDQLEEFKKERNACIIGAKIAREHNLAIGDNLPMQGDIYPGNWNFAVRGIYTGKDESTDETAMFFHWKYLDEQIGQTTPGRQSQVGWYVFRVNNPDRMPEVAAAIDEEFLNSRAGTKTETEREFQQSFVSMSSTIITSLEVISFVIIGLILIVLANTIVMSVRERSREYAVLKTIGFNGGHVVGLISGESLLLAIIGGLVGLGMTFPIAAGFAKAFPTFFPVFIVEPGTIAMALGIALSAGVIAAFFPAMRILRTRIAEGLRTIG